MFLSLRPKRKKFVKEPFCFSKKFLESKSFWIKVRGGGHITFLAKNFSHRTVKLHKRTCLCFRKNMVTNKILSLGGRKSSLSVNFFGLTVLKNSVKEPFCISDFSWYRKFLKIREGEGITGYQKVFISQYRKASEVNPSVFQGSSDIKNFHALEGGITAFSKVSSPTWPRRKTSEEKSAAFQKTSGIEKGFWTGGGSITVLARKFSHSTKKFHMWTFLCSKSTW